MIPHLPFFEKGFLGRTIYIHQDLFGTVRKLVELVQLTRFFGLPDWLESQKTKTLVGCRNLRWCVFCMTPCGFLLMKISMKLEKINNWQQKKDTSWN